MLNLPLARNDPFAQKHVSDLWPIYTNHKCRGRYEKKKFAQTAEFGLQLTGGTPVGHSLKILAATLTPIFKPNATEWPPPEWPTPVSHFALT